MKDRAKGYVFMAMSLDGFVARKDNDLSWLMKYDTKGEDQGYDGFVEKIEVMIMGSGTFKKVLGFEAWPYKKPVMVMSHSMTNDDIPENLRPTVQVTSAAPNVLMEELFAKGLKRVYVDGGLVVQSFLRAGLVEEITLTIIPLLIGDGKRLFGEINEDIDLELLDSKKLNCGFVQNHYKVLKQA